MLLLIMNENIGLEGLANTSHTSSNYDSWLDIKPILEQNEEIQNKIYKILSNEGEQYKLGSGYAHSAYSLGSILKDGEEKHLALRVAVVNLPIKHLNGQVISYNIDDLKKEISRFDEAKDEIISGMYESNSENEIKPIEFAGVVALRTEDKTGKNVIKNAIITEDLSKGKKYNVSAGSGDETAIITDKHNNFISESFIDPAHSAKDIGLANKYLDMNAMLNIYR